MKVYVVMGNDFPDSVFATEMAADAYCAEQKAKEKPDTRRIYWRVYEFEVKT